MKRLFIGEERSEFAKRAGWTWSDGRLAGKQLFDALKANHINPNNSNSCDFINYFEYDDMPNALKVMIERYRPKIFAMGRRVERELKKHGIPHVYIVHPAARGRIRLKKNYINHIKEALAALPVT